MSPHRLQRWRWAAVGLMCLAALAWAGRLVCGAARGRITSELELALALSAADAVATLAPADADADSARGLSSVMESHPFVDQVYMIQPGLERNAWDVVASGVPQWPPLDFDGDGVVGKHEAYVLEGSVLDSRDRPALAEASESGEPRSETRSVGGSSVVSVYVPLPGAGAGRVVVAEMRVPAVGGLPAAAMAAVGWLALAGALAVLLMVGHLRQRRSKGEHRWSSGLASTAVRALCGAGDGVMVIDGGGRVCAWEGAVAEWFELGRDEAVGAEISDVLPAKAVEVIREALVRAMEGDTGGGSPLPLPVVGGEGGTGRVTVHRVEGVDGRVSMVMFCCRVCPSVEAGRVWSAFYGDGVRVSDEGPAAILARLVDSAEVAKAYVVRGSGKARLRVTERRVRSPQQCVSESDVLSAAGAAVDAGRLHVHGVQRRDGCGWDYIVAVPLGREKRERAALVVVPEAGACGAELWCAIELAGAALSGPSEPAHARAAADHVLHLIPAPAMSIDDEGNIRDCNGEARMMLWGEATAASGLGAFADVCAVAPNALRAAAAVGRFQGPVVLSSAEKGALSALLSVKRVYDGSGNPSGYLAVAYDITSEETAISELRRRNEELESANNRLGGVDERRCRFLADMSHELRTPLNSIIGFSEILLDGMGGDLPSEGREFVTSIHQGGAHLLAIVNDILDLSKIEAGRLVLRPAPCDMAALINYARLTVSTMSEATGMKLETALEPHLPQVLGDQLRLRQILLNLMSNAVKFTPEGGSVTVSARSEGGWVVVSVRDTGRGISVADQRIIFEPFRQVAVHSEGQGTGLGLPITKRLVEMHGGTLDLDSEPGRGSTFTIYLPVSPGEEPEPEADTSAEDGGVEAAAGAQSPADICDSYN